MHRVHTQVHSAFVIVIARDLDRFARLSSAPATVSKGMRTYRRKYNTQVSIGYLESSR